MQIYSIDGLVPVVDPSAFVHPTAVLIGDVIIGAGCYVGPCASLRGDFGRVILEPGSNVQDTCVMHAFPGCDVTVKTDGHVGHGAVLHGCTVGSNALVGMNAVIMDKAAIGRECIVAAGAFVKAGFECPPRSLLVGAPARKLREISAEELDWKTKGTREYQQLAIRSLNTMQRTSPLTAVEPDRPRLEMSSYQTKNQHTGESE